MLSDAQLSYAWYVRVPDLVAFLSRVSPVLERNLAESDLGRHTGAVDVSLYRTGVRIVLESGRVKAVEDWRPSTVSVGDVAFPDWTFLQLIFGFRSLDDLRGVGPTRRKTLLRELGSLKAVREASLEELETLLGPVVGGRVYAQLPDTGPDSIDSAAQ